MNKYPKFIKANQYLETICSNITHAGLVSTWTMRAGRDCLNI